MIQACFYPLCETCNTFTCPFCKVYLHKAIADGEEQWHWVCPTLINDYFWHYAILMNGENEVNGYIVTHERVHLHTEGKQSRLSFFNSGFNTLQDSASHYFPAIKLDINDTEAISNKLKLLVTYL